jgi:hypothetical protein
MLPVQLRSKMMQEWMAVQLMHVGTVWQLGSDHVSALRKSIAVTVETDILVAQLQAYYPTIAGKSMSIFTYTETLPVQFAGYVGEGHTRCYTAYKSEVAGASYYLKHGFATEHRFIVDYVVKVPNQYQVNDTEIRAILNQYKPFSKQYEIQYY